MKIEYTGLTWTSMRFMILSVLFFLLHIHSGKSQSYHTISGRVIDAVNGETLPGVSIYAKDASRGVTSDSRGEYSIALEQGEYMLAFRYLGYETQEHPILLTEDIILDVWLDPSAVILQEVVVTSQRSFFGNMDYGRELPSIGVTEISKQNINMASDLLHARVPGVWATKTSGAPGDHQRIRIRGQTSFFASAEPLYVIDGVPVPIVNLSSIGISHLNIHDIENITILRDASSASLYGYQGGNGVVLIDTKTGGKSEFNFLIRTGIQTIPQFYHLNSSAQLIETLDSARSILNSPLRIAYPNITDSLCNRNWQDEIFTTGKLQEYQISGSGRLGNVNVYAGGNYTGHDGILRTSAYNRYTGSLRLGTTFYDRLAINLGYRGSSERNHNNLELYRGNNMIISAISTPPSIECTPEDILRNTSGLNSPYRPRTFVTWYKSLYDDDRQPGQMPQTPLEYWDENRHTIAITSQSLDVSARFRINDNLSVNIMESAFLRSSGYDADFTYETFPALSQHQYFQRGKLVLESNENVFLANHQINISHIKNVNKHSINTLVAHRYYLDNLSWMIDTIIGQMPERYSLKNSMVAFGPKGNTVRRLTSYVAHMSYDYDRRYFISAVGHLGRIREGVQTDYYNLFPSLALAWDISREHLLQNLNFIDEFKVYYNIGVAGNYPLNGFVNDLYGEIDHTINQERRRYQYVRQFANHSLRHEHVTEANYGVRAAFFRGRLGFSGVHFVKEIENMLLLRAIPFYYGGGKAFVNLGRVSVAGYELGINATPIQTARASWVLNMNYFTSQQVVSKLGDLNEMRFSDGDILFPDFILKEGDPIGNIYGYRFLGRASAEELAEQDENIDFLLGDKYLNADGKKGLTPDDKVVVGNSIPKHNFNLLSSFQYRQWGLDMIWYGVMGLQKYNATLASAVMTGLAPQATQFIADSLFSMTRQEFYESDIFVEDASFIRLKRVSISYWPEWRILGNVKPGISLSFENFYTFTSYSGYDPEATIFTDNNFSDNGIDRGAYPSPKSVFLTFQMRF